MFEDCRIPLRIINYAIHLHEDGKSAVMSLVTETQKVYGTGPERTLSGVFVCSDCGQRVLIDTLISNRPGMEPMI